MKYIQITSNNVSECVNCDKIISGYDTVFDFHVKFDILGFFNFWTFFYQTFTSKTTSFKHVLEKVPSAKWPHELGENIMFSSKSGLYIVFYHQNLDF